ncbi:Hypothetical protein PENO1_105250 [Penicillium occitanis (nom. inval.)]|nr:Hypothetical protein PENO1_105250 [Penicillium occitanis (nom. inval.)]PCG90378.1 hypothetical protein PENOC_102320 [Penicillium occitanis (nom. inval.)]
MMLAWVLALCLIPLSECTHLAFKNLNTSVFINPSLTTSKGGNAACITGKIPVGVTANVTNWAVDVPSNQLATTDFVDIATSTAFSDLDELIEGTQLLQKTYNIWVELCVPAQQAQIQNQSIQILTHGAVLDHTYWDFTSGYSYVDAAAQAGLVTLNYDRLGIGKSDHPDPLLEDQGNVALEVLHGLVSIVRSNVLGCAFKKVIAVGHSFGSQTTVATISKYPEDFDAAIITGLAKEAGTDWQQRAEISFGLLQANLVPGRFRGLPNGYLAPGSVAGVQLVFFKYPYFDPAILNATFDNIQTFSAGEMLINPTSAFLGNPQVLAAWKQPVLIMLGEHDFAGCGLSCSTPQNQANLTLTGMFPSADPGLSRSVIIDDSGHSINLHFNATFVYKTQTDWVNQLD